MNDFSQNASGFNCVLIPFEKLDMGWGPRAWFPWQRQDHTRWQLFLKGQCADPPRTFNSGVDVLRSVGFHSTGVVAAIAVHNYIQLIRESTVACRNVYTRSQYATWLNWRSDCLRSGVTSNCPSLTAPLTSGENDLRHVSRLSDSISNSYCNLYFCLSFIVCIDSKFLTIEKSLLDKSFS